MTKLIEKLKQLERLDQLIRMKATGSPKDLARRMGISERTVFNLLDTLRELGADVHYCRSRGAYFYKSNIEFNFNIVKNRICDI